RARPPRRSEPSDDPGREPFGGRSAHDSRAAEEAPRARRARHSRAADEPESFPPNPAHDDIDDSPSGRSAEPLTEAPTVGRSLPVPPRRSPSSRGSAGPFGPLGAAGPPGPSSGGGGQRPSTITGRASVRSTGPGSGAGVGAARHAADRLDDDDYDAGFDADGGEGPGGRGPGGPYDGGTGGPYGGGRDRGGGRG